MESNHKDKDKKEKHKRDKSASKDGTLSSNTSDVGDMLSKQTDITHNVTLQDTTCDFVTVYSDRAEVTRTLQVAIEKEGMNIE